MVCAELWVCSACAINLVLVGLIVVASYVARDSIRALEPSRSGANYCSTYCMTTGGLVASMTMLEIAPRKNIARRNVIGARQWCQFWTGHLQSIRSSG